MLLTDELNDARERELQKVWLAWRARALSVTPVDRVRVEAACHLAYREAGLDPPEMILWVRSPLAGCLASLLLQRISRHNRSGVPRHPFDLTVTTEGSPVARTILSEVRNEIATLLTGRLAWLGCSDGAVAAERVYRRVLRDVYRQIQPGASASVAWNSMLDSLTACFDQLERWAQSDVAHLHPMDAFDGDSLEPLWNLERITLDQLLIEVPPPVRRYVRKKVSSWRCESPILAWVALAEFFQHLRRSATPCAGMTELIRSQVWWWLFAKVAILSEPPSAIHLDQRDRLHNDNGMAVAYSDGWGVYAWHGLRISEQVIVNPDTLTPEQVLGERNVEIRRVMIERLGLDRFLTSAQTKVLDTDQAGTRRLYRLAFRDDVPIVAVRVQCPSTGQIYFLRVPPNFRTCRDAVAWTFGFERAEDYQPVAES